MIKKIIFIISFILCLTGISAQNNYVINDNAKTDFIGWYDSSGYWNNVYWYTNWSDLTTWQAWMITDNLGYNDVKDIMNKPIYNQMFNDLNTQKSLGTLTTDAVNNFYNTLFGDIQSSNSPNNNVGSLPLELNIIELILLFSTFILFYLYFKFK